MYEQLTKECRELHSRNPILKNQFNSWRRLSITRQFFEQAQIANQEKLESQTLPGVSYDEGGNPITRPLTCDEVALNTARRDGFTEGIEFLLDWNPVDEDEKEKEDADS